MKILQVINFFKPSWEAGGLVRAVYELSKNLLERDHEITVYTTDGFKWRLNVEKNKPIDVDGIRTYYFRNLSGYLPRKLPLFPYYMPMVARKEIMDFDVIHVNGLTTLGFIVQHYAKKFGIPYILQGHGSLFFKMGGRVSFFSNGSITIEKRRFLKKALNAIFEHPTLHNASKVIALTKTEAEQCKTLAVDEDKIEIIPNGVNLSEFDNLPKRGAFRRKYLMRADEKVVLYLGRIHRIKGIDLLVKASAELLKKLDDVRLVIVGPDDGFLPAVKKYIRELKLSDRILFTGPLYGREKLEAYVDADAYVLPSIYETFPNTVLEAWACGKPVIVTDRCGIADVVSKVGFVVEYDKGQLQDAIFKLLSNEGLRERFGTEAKKLVREKFSLGNTVEKLEALYEKLIK